MAINPANRGAVQGGKYAGQCLGSLGLVEMLTFMTLLILAYAYAWKKGALEWVK